MRPRLSETEPAHLIDINGIPDLRGIRIDGDTVHIGAMTTESAVIASDLLREKCPLLPEAAGNSGMIVGMILAEAVVPGFGDGIAGASAVTTMLLTMVFGMTSGMWVGWWFAGWILGGWRGSVSNPEADFWR